MKTRILGATHLEVFPICLGGNVFGWTADEGQSFEVLDAYIAAGGNFIDTADSYSAWAPGHSGGESEKILGRWIEARGNRDEIILGTKVGMKPDRKGLAPESIRKAFDESLERLRTDRIDIYYAHEEDESTPIEESLETFAALIEAGRVGCLGASNYSPAGLRAALAASDRTGLPRYSVLQAHYNLAERAVYEDELAGVCEESGMACLSYFSLAHGFLTGKYRPGAAALDTPRAPMAGRHLEGRGVEILEVLDRIAAKHETTPGAVSLAWLMTRPTVVGPLASGRNPSQVAAFLPAIELALDPQDLDELDRVSA